MNLTDTQRAIAAECDAIKSLLLEKNAAYGNSAIEPMRIFSKASSVEQILVRIDDKLSRLARGQAAGEDVELDLIGYLVLLRVARAKARPVCPGCYGVDLQPHLEGCVVGGLLAELDEAPPVCPGCHAVGPEPHATGCIDAEIEAEQREAIERGDRDREVLGSEEEP